MCELAQVLELLQLAALPATYPSPPKQLLNSCSAEKENRRESRVAKKPAHDTEKFCLSIGLPRYPALCRSSGSTEPARKGGDRLLHGARASSRVWRVLRAYCAHMREKQTTPNRTPLHPETSPRPQSSSRVRRVALPPMHPQEIWLLQDSSNDDEKISSHFSSPRPAE